MVYLHEQATEVSRYYLTFADCHLAVSHSKSSHLPRVPDSVHLAQIASLDLIPYAAGPIGIHAAEEPPERPTGQADAILIRDGAIVQNHSGIESAGGVDSQLTETLHMQAGHREIAVIVVQ